MLRKQLFLILIALCFVFYGCGDEGIKTTLHDLGAAPSVQGVVGPVPEPIKEIIWGKDVETLKAELKYAIDRDEDGIFIDANGRRVLDPNGIRAKSMIHSICYRQAREAYYTKFISAGGVAIMGHGYIDDRFFYAARDIALGMTQKRPELRVLLTPSSENRPGATQLDTRHDVTNRPTPSRKFRMILVHNDMSLTSVPEYYLGNGVVHFRVAQGLGGFWPSWAWGYVGGYSHSEKIWMYETFSHEFAHAIHAAIRLIDPTFDDRLQAAYEAVKDNPLVGKTRRGAMEYWAHSATDWFDEVATQQWYHDQFLQNEPLMYELLNEWFDLIDLSVIETRVYE